MPLFPPRATVVLFAGLAGDVETETTYRDQLQSWLEILQESAHPQEVFVLGDNPGAVANSAATNAQDQTQPVADHASRITHHSILPIHFFPADRTNFLDLGQKLAGNTNPLVVIAWGHGGRQGATPVFHVRGRRLTPEDFQAFAYQSGAWESHWVLLFRGSGAFASQLARGQRQILSSEAGTMFTSDPVGMAVLLKLARAKPALSFAALSEEFGRATAAWYSERHLARTEEPAFWTGNGKPLLLAAQETDGPTSAKDASEAPTNKTAQAQSSDLPSAWKEITRVDPKKFPDADGVVLRRRLSYTLGSNPAIASEQAEFVQILTLEGKRLGDFDISYSPPFEDITFLDCEVLSPAGKMSRLDPDAIREAREESVGDYQMGRRKFFSLPGVVPGAVLHVRYRTQWKDFPLPHVSLEIPVGRELPVIAAAVQVTIPKAAPFHFAFEPSSAIDPDIKQSNYGTTYSWRFENLPALEQELLTSPRRQAELLISTFPDWAAFAEWYARISKLTDEITPEIRTKAAELTRESKTEREKVVAIYNYVTSLRYVAVPLGVNSFRPHAAANVLENQFGDCKDKANLFNTLLHSMNIPAHLVLVPRFSQAHDALPALAFNHAISRVTLAGQTLWVDTTDDVCRFGLLPPGDPGRKVLVIDGSSSALTQLPAPDPKEHRLTLRGEIDWLGAFEPDAALPVALSATALGYPDYELRAAAQETKAHRASLPLLAARFRPVAGAFALEKQTATSAAALDENFTWHATGTYVGAASIADQPEPIPAPPPTTHDTRHPLPATWLLHSPFWLPKEWDLALHRRKAGLFLNQGYPLTLEEDFEIALPATTRDVLLPAFTENEEGPLRWRVQWRKSGEGKLNTLLQVELERGELSAAETPLLQRQLRSLLAALSASASLSLR